MEIIPIFADTLYSCHYPDGESDEFASIFKNWSDAEQLRDFFEKNEKDLKSGFYGEITIEEAIVRTKNDAKWLEGRLLALSESDNPNLDSIFVELENNQYKSVELAKRKAKGKESKSWLRIYAIKIDANCYVVTGGTIKLTFKMEDREHTHKELRKLEKCRDYLKELGIIDKDSFIEFTELNF